MRRIVVDLKKCAACGVCSLKCDLLEERLDGKARTVNGGAFDDTDSKVMRKMVDVVGDCPSSALSMSEWNSTSKTGKAGLKDLLKRLEKESKNFSVERVSDGDIFMSSSIDDIDFPKSSQEGRYDYSSESQAREAAKSEFIRLCYSESAYRPIIKKILVSYKLSKLKPYYTFDENQVTVYYRYNKQIRELLSEIFAEANMLLKGKSPLPESWKDFCVSLDENDSIFYCLANFDELVSISDVFSKFQKEEYNSLNDHIEMDFEFDSHEFYTGKNDIFGDPKYKEKWCFRCYNSQGFQGVADSFFSDLWRFIALSNIEPFDAVNGVLGEFERKVKEALNKKIKEFCQLNGLASIFLEADESPTMESDKFITKTREEQACRLAEKIYRSHGIPYPK